MNRVQDLRELFGGLTVIKKQASCFLKHSHSTLMSFLTFKLIVTSARTFDGRFSPRFGFPTWMTANLVIGCAIRAHPLNRVEPSSAHQGFSRNTASSMSCRIWSGNISKIREMDENEAINYSNKASYKSILIETAQSSEASNHEG